MLAFTWFGARYGFRFISGYITGISEVLFEESVECAELKRLQLPIKKRMINPRPSSVEEAEEEFCPVYSINLLSIRLIWRFSRKLFQLSAQLRWRSEHRFEVGWNVSQNSSVSRVNAPNLVDWLLVHTHRWTTLGCRSMRAPRKMLTPIDMRAHINWRVLINDLSG